MCRKKWICYICALAMLIGSVIFWKSNEIKADNLMIVAHPDDEMIWGGYALQKKPYYVVCLTNCDNPVRKKKFAEMMKTLHCEYEIWSFPDKVNGKRDNWNSCREEIRQKLKAVITGKHWQSIVTHNPDGEYGHIHHQMTSQIVTDLDTDKDNLYYFGKYYKRKNINEDLTVTDKKGLIDKQGLRKIYASQNKVMDHLEHMFDHEGFVHYKDWKYE